jgi:hypothetical protein
VGVAALTVATISYMEIYCVSVGERRSKEDLPIRSAWRQL